MRKGQQWRPGALEASSSLLDHIKNSLFILSTIGGKALKEFGDRKHMIRIVFLKDPSVYGMVNRLEGGRSGCEETNIEATAGTLGRKG